MQSALGEPHVEVDVEPLERGLQLGELEVVGEIAGGDHLLLVGELEQVGPLGQHAAGELLDVRARIAVLGCRLALRRSEHRAAEALHLGARVVDVELAGDRRAAGEEQPRDRVAERRPAGVADVEGAGRVGADELDVDRVAALAVVRAEGGAGIDDRLGEGAGGRGIQSDVDEPGSCHLDARDAVDLGEPAGDLGRELARVGADGLRELERGVRGPVAVIAVLRTVERQIRRGEPFARSPASRLRERDDDGEEGGGEGVGIHSPSSLRAAPRGSPSLRSRPVRLHPTAESAVVTHVLGIPLEAQRPADDG